LPSFLALNKSDGEEDSLLDDAPEEQEIQGEDLILENPPLYDEVQLREMVRELVREELRGELGDKITRNIRMLIRREMSTMLKGAKKP